MIGNFLRSAALSCVLTSLLLAGCEQTAVKEAVPVSGINYTGKDLNSFLFEDVANEGKAAGGVGLDPYQGGGTMCCIALPRKWHPGIKVRLRYDWWTGSSLDRDFQYVTAEIPPYPTGQAAMLWALFHEDGSVEVIASAVDPGHPEWPGKVKHWPIPSREYRVKLWQMDYDESLSAIRDLESPEVLSPAAMQAKWDFFGGLAPETRERIKNFSGPSDPQFAAFVEEFRKESLAHFRHRADHLLQHRP